ncbi:E3 ubiquitin-protein ligase TRIM9-like isoform X2 [Apostichopus japonicus]|uniref:E3 ubiquitin-protein ligase TRIM9-like isoform X2 n=1 Tax=Stichopus japonicus TaxID=307972 RepID=UPI003AB7D86B
MQLKRFATRLRFTGPSECEKMDEELRCYACGGNFKTPVLLPCAHNVCLICAHDLQAKSNIQGQFIFEQQLDFLDFPDTDRLSAASDGDSGVSYAGYAPSAISSASSGSTSSCSSGRGSTSGSGGVLKGIGGNYPPLQTDSVRLTCPKCHRTIFLDDRGVESLPRNLALESIVARYAQIRNRMKCQLCEKDAKDAEVYCEQCDIFYCHACKESCHPSRGPLAQHTLTIPSKGKLATGSKAPPRISTCSEHKDENLSMYCIMCKVPVCYLCQNEGKHMNHEMNALGAMSKVQKGELSQSLTALTDRARTAKNFLIELKNTIDKVEESSIDFEASLVAKFDELISIIQRRKEQLIHQVQREKDFKTKMVRNHINQCSGKLKQTSTLLEFSIEIMKESDPASFLLVSNSLIDRARHTESSWEKEMILAPRVDHEFDLTLESGPAVKAIERLNFKEMKAPDPPIIIPSECSAENNSVTIAWQAHPSSWVEGYVLELDDGNNGAFREVYCGRETICTVDGLHFDTTYHARVKAYNHAGEGDYCDTICLQTAEVAWFQPDPRTAHQDILFLNDNLTITCQSLDDRVVLGNVGFSKGVHYWEVTIDRYDNHPDPAFGVARFDCTKDQMLGKDEKSWSMYIDSNRSWFIHNNAHSDRTEGGIGVGSVIGVLLDLDKQTLCFYVNDRRQGPVAFTGLKGVFFPSISLNRNVQLTVHPGLDIPAGDEE